MYGIGVDYRQVVSADTDCKLSELEELRDAMQYVITVWESCSSKVRDAHIDMIGDLETWVSSLEDEIRDVEIEINGEIDSVDSSYCD